MYNLLCGIKVLECSLLLNGGQVGMYFADLGAEVIKIEDPVRGDYIRDILGQVAPRESPAHLQIHKNKKSVALDLHDPKAREIFFKLLQTADVFIDGLRPGACDAMGVGYDALRAAKPNIIYVQCTGYGAYGPYANVPTHGYQMTALPGGLPAQVMEDGTVQRTRGVQYFGGVEESSAASNLGAQAATMSALAALVRRDRSGEGACIDVGASDAVLAAAWQGIIYNLNYDRITDFRGLSRKQASYDAKWPKDSVRYQLYSTSDDKFVLFAAIEKKFWDGFCRVAQREDLIDTIRPELAIDYGEDKPHLRKEVQDIIGRRTLREWMSIAAELGLPIGPANSLEDMPSDPHIQARGMLVETSDPEAGDFTYVAFPALIQGQTYGLPVRAPKLGQHTTEVLGGLSMGVDEVESAD